MIISLTFTDDDPQDIMFLFLNQQYNRRANINTATSNSITPIPYAQTGPTVGSVIMIEEIYQL